MLLSVATGSASSLFSPRHNQGGVAEASGSVPRTAGGCRRQAEGVPPGARGCEPLRIVTNGKIALPDLFDQVSLTQWLIDTVFQFALIQPRRGFPFY